MSKTIEAGYFVESSGDALARRAAQYLLDRIREAVKARGLARVAISGGSTPRSTFEHLAEESYRKQMPWDRLEIYWVDERCVPPDHPESNYRMTREALLDKVPLDASRIFRIRGELEPEKAASEYETEIRRSFRLEGAELPVFDVIALGMGPDGHTASLFPHTEALHEQLRIAVANHVLSQKETWRVTLTWPVINQGRDVFFLVKGEDKAIPLRSVLLGPSDPEELPSQLIQPRNGRITLLLDSAAAALLPEAHRQGNGILEIRR
ncbi:MAG TPA: 6-phosphogluconolactonase [Acidobacteriaceae bacterium]|nr:6-phosphogluconolactonase [Acidobacteriaceae bacterium]